MMKNFIHVAMLLFADNRDVATAMSESCSWVKAVEWGHRQGYQHLHQCHTWTRAIQQYQRAEAKLGGAVTTISKKVDTINQHIDKVLENAPTKLKVSVNVNDADWQKIQELFAKERQWMTAQMQMHIREVNSMFADERKKVRERYKEYDGCYLGHYAQWFFWFFFSIGFGAFLAMVVSGLDSYYEWYK